MEDGPFFEVKVLLGNWDHALLKRPHSIVYPLFNICLSRLFGVELVEHVWDCAATKPAASGALQCTGAASHGLPATLTGSP